MQEPIRIQVMRSQLGRVRGTGAGGGVHHWYVERLTSIALVPLTLWFIFSVLRLLGAPHQAMVDWVANPINTVLLLALVAMTFHHLQLGAQVILEDYVNAKWLMNILVLGIKGVSLLLALACAVAIIKMAV